jgi:hypothetical protein
VQAMGHGSPRLRHRTYFELFTELCVIMLGMFDTGQSGLVSHGVLGG